MATEPTVWPTGPNADYSPIRDYLNSVVMEARKKFNTVRVEQGRPAIPLNDENQWTTYYLPLFPVAGFGPNGIQGDSVHAYQGWPEIHDAFNKMLLLWRNSLTGATPTPPPTPPPTPTPTEPPVTTLPPGTPPPITTPPVPTPSPITPGIIRLHGGRYAAEARYAAPGGVPTRATPVGLTDDVAYFWFLSANNVELLVGALASSPGRAAVKLMGATNLEFWVDVTDTVTGERWSYHNEQGKMFGVVAWDALPG
jgi:hypothetical protein